MSLGRRLAAARAERGLSLEDVSRATRIRVPILAALESDDVGAAGPPAYVRGHLRTIAGVLGLDPAALLTEYERKAPSAPVAPATWQVRDRAVARADRRSPSWLGATVVTMTAVVTLLGIGVLVEPDDQLTVAGPPPQATAPPPAPVPAAEGGGEAAPGAEAREPAPDDPAGDDRVGDETVPDVAGVTGRGPAAAGTGSSASAAASPVRVRVSVDEDGRSWLQVVDATGKSLHAAVLDAGEAEEFTSESELRLTVGDASAVSVEVDGRPVDVPGDAGDVAKLRVAPGGAVTSG